MVILKNDYASGNMFTAGDTTGVSGINDITNRINTHTHDGTDTTNLRNIETWTQPAGSVVGAATVWNTMGSVVMIGSAGIPIAVSLIGKIWNQGATNPNLKYQLMGSQAGITGSMLYPNSLYVNDSADDVGIEIVGIQLQGANLGSANPSNIDNNMFLSTNLTPVSNGSFVIFGNIQGAASPNYNPRYSDVLLTAVEVY